MWLRPIKIEPTDWKYQIAQTDGDWWVNKVGTYGVASAQLYWGRTGALLLRIMYYLFPMVDWAFVFCGRFLLAPPINRRSTLYMRPCGYPTCLGGSPELEEDSAATDHHLRHPTSGTDSPNGYGETQQGLGILHCISRGCFHIQGLGQYHGQTAVGNIYLPLGQTLAPTIVAMEGSSQVKRQTKPTGSDFAKLIATLIGGISYNLPLPAPSPWRGASDASAGGDGSYVGGWLSDQDPVSKEEVWWFQLHAQGRRHASWRPITGPTHFCWPPSWWRKESATGSNFAYRWSRTTRATFSPCWINRPRLFWCDWFSLCTLLSCEERPQYLGGWIDSTSSDWIQPGKTPPNLSPSAELATHWWIGCFKNFIQQLNLTGDRRHGPWNPREHRMV